MDGKAAAEQVLHQGGIELGWSQQIVDQRALIRSVQGGSIRIGLGQHPAHQAEAVAVDTAAGHADHGITRLNLLSINQLALFNNGDAEPGQVVATRWVEARHFGGFAAEQRAAALLAAVSDALNNLSHGVRAQCARGHVVEKKQRLGAGCDHVVHAHRHQVDPNVVVGLVVLRQFEFGADTISP